MENLLKGLLEIKKRNDAYFEKYRNVREQAEKIESKIFDKYGYLISFNDEYEAQERLDKSIGYLGRLYAGEFSNNPKSADLRYSFVEKALIENKGGVWKCVERKLGKEALILFQSEPKPGSKPKGNPKAWLIGGILLSFLIFPLVVGVGKFLSLTIQNKKFDEESKNYNEYLSIKQKYGKQFDNVVAEYQPVKIPSLEEAKKEIEEAIEDIKKMLFSKELNEEYDAIIKDFENLLKPYEMKVLITCVDELINLIKDCTTVEEAKKLYNEAVEIKKQCEACYYYHNKGCSQKRRNCASFMPK